MTAEEWEASKAPKKMFESLPQGTSSRKLRLYSCACCRGAWHLMTNEQCRRAVEVGERFADGLTREKERALAQKEADRQFAHILHGRDLLQVASSWAVVKTTTSARLAANICSSNIRSVIRAKSLHRVQVEHLRCIFGNPFRPVVLVPAFSTPTIVSLAQTAYDERLLPSGELDRDRLAVLSDVLEEAGCDDAAVLDHLRGPGRHARGCWVVDQLIGKA